MSCSALKTEHTLAHLQFASVMSNELLFSFQGIVCTRMSEDVLKDVCIIRLTKHQGILCITYLNLQ